MLQSLKTNLAKYPYYIVLIPLFFVWHGFAENARLLHLKDVLLLASYYTVGALILFLVCKLIFRDSRKAALICGICMIFYFFFGAIYDFLKANSPSAFFYRYSVILSILTLLVITLAVIIKKSHRSNHNVFFYINLLLIIYLSVDTINIIRTINSHLQEKSSSIGKLSSTSRKPDIYLLIFDEYASSASLNRQYHFHNTVDSILTAQNFHLQAGSRANYNYTPFSMASLLNMEYLSLEKKSFTWDNYLSCIPRIRENKLIAFLEDNGYQFNNLSIFEVNSQAPFTQQSLLHLKTSVISENTLLSRLERDCAAVFKKTKVFAFLVRHRENYLQSGLRIMEELKQISGSTSNVPRFVYAHLYMPHAPHYCDRSGKPFAADSKLSPQEQYLEYLSYTNTLIDTTVQAIQKNTHQKAVIVVLGDHGYRTLSNNQEQFPNLNAVFYPAGIKSTLYDSITNVNLFRTILNDLFQKNIALLPDSTVFLKGPRADVAQ